MDSFVASKEGDLAQSNAMTNLMSLGLLITRQSCFLMFFLALSAAAAETLTGRVVGIADGDTITVLDSNRQQHKIRLSGIDAPEKKQPFGERSKQHLAEMVFNKTVTVEWQKLDRYGRTVGKVMVNGVDVNLVQVKAGMAWWYEKYRKEQSERDQYLYSAQEQEAKAKRVGLWSDQNPVPPWDWRKSRFN